MDVLLNPRIGSPSWATTEAQKIDEDAPEPSPRPADQEETVTINTVRAIQSALSQKIEAGGFRREPKAQDMLAVLQPFGPNWVSLVPLYQLAVDTMDLGINVWHCEGTPVVGRGMVSCLEYLED